MCFKRKHSRTSKSYVKSSVRTYRNADHFCSWAGIVPECKESAGKKMSTKIRKGNKFFKATIVKCGRAAIRKKDSYFYARYQKIAARCGGKRALDYEKIKNKI
ncbi:transposase [Cellulosilyticum ruminicola]|uniref:transposase n=1 Tax=Cellulosilyticum ruminicola TaxID=425254 RepID=UPI0009FA523A